MKAAIVKKFGPPEVIQTTAERPMPSMGKNEVMFNVYIVIVFVTVPMLLLLLVIRR